MEWEKIDKCLKEAAVGFNNLYKEHVNVDTHLKQMTKGETAIVAVPASSGVKTNVHLTGLFLDQVKEVLGNYEADLKAKGWAIVKDLLAKLNKEVQP